MKNYNSYAVLKFNSFWESMKAIEVLGMLRHNGVPLKLGHVYGGLKVVDGRYEESFEGVEGEKKGERMAGVVKGCLEEIVGREKKMEIDIFA